MAQPGVPGPDAKPEVLRDVRFTVDEGLAYRAARTGAIWMNKLFFASLILGAVWLAWGGLTGETGCVEGLPPDPNGTADPSVTRTQCNVFLTPTTAYLAAMAVLTFVLSLAFGVIGLVVGKRIVEATPADEEVGAGTPPGPKQGDGGR